MPRSAGEERPLVAARLVPCLACPNRWREGWACSSARITSILHVTARVVSRVVPGLEVSVDSREIDILARLNRIPVWSLPWRYLGIIAIGYFFTAESFPTRARATGFAFSDGIGHAGGVVGGVVGAIVLPTVVGAVSSPPDSSRSASPAYSPESSRLPDPQLPVGASSRSSSSERGGWTRLPDMYVARHSAPRISVVQPVSDRRP